MWLHLLICTAILATNPEAALFYAKPGQVLPIESQQAGVTLEASFGNGAVVPVTTLRAPEDGLHLLALFSRDPLGNVSQPRWYLLQVDGLPPTTELRFSQQPVSDASGQRWVGPNTEVTLSTEDEGAGLKIAKLTINGQEMAESEAVISKVLQSHGAKDISFTAEDLVGNISAPETVRISLDNVPPTGQIYIEGRQATVGNRLIVGTDVTIRADVQDPDSGLELWEPRINGKAIGQKQWPTTWKPGIYEVSAFAKDKVGNEVELGQGKFEVDAEPPQASWEVSSQIFTNEKGVRYYRLPITVALKAEDAIFGNRDIEFFDPDQGWLRFEKPITINETYLAIRSSDGVGNTLTQTLTWPQDQKGPQITLRNTAGDVMEPGQKIRIAQGEELFPEIIDQESGISSQGFHFDDGVHKALPNWFRFRKRDQLVLTIYATDYLGNQSRVQYPISVSRAGKQEAP